MPQRRTLLHAALPLIFTLAVCASQSQPLASYATPNAPLLGSASYPEQWPKSQWDKDLQFMQDAHMNVVRIGEFAWSSLEPSEGRYDLDWMEQAIDLAAKHHIAVVIGTPTDAPPAWLTSKYPDTLGMNADGHLRGHGNRRQFNYASPRYRHFCSLIVTQLGKRFGHNPDVIGWQIGNEYTDESFDPATEALFQQFLRNKYKTLANLNKQWSTAYWSQTYTAWSQIPMENAGGNPGLLLDHKHFVTATWRSFQREQIDTLRSYILPAQFITTNIGGLGWSDNWDHYAITADLNLAGWDDYVGEGHLQVSRNAMLNDFVRGWKRRNFWVMETEPGSVNWAPINNSLYPGETRALAWQTIGHGADAVLYWQWRSALNGQEQYHGAIVGPDGKPNPIYAEIQQLGHDLDLTRSVLAGSTPRAEIALLHDYDSRWAIDFQPHTRLYDQQQILLRFYEPLEQRAESSAHAVDIVDPAAAPLDRYKLLVAPSLNVISQQLADKLLAYVRQGGHLILGPRSGMKDQYNSLNPQRQPGPLAAALGARVEEYYALEEPPSGPLTLVPAAAPNQSSAKPLPSGTASIWAETLALLPQQPGNPALRIDLRYHDPGGWLDGKPAMVTHMLGAGSITYLGAIPSPELLAAILNDAANAAHVVPSTIALPPSVELCVRTDQSDQPDGNISYPGHSVYILINHGESPAQATIPGRFHNLLPEIAITPTDISNSIHATTVSLPAQGIAVLTPESAQ